jgi:hypothetical protein
MEYTYEQWFELFEARLRQLGWTGPIDNDSAYNDFHQENNPVEAAEELFEELNGDDE